MRVAFVQMNPEFGRPEINVEKALTLMKSKPADLYVLPEFFNSGYAFISRQEVADMAEPAGEGKTFLALSEFTKINNCAVVYGFPEKAPEGYYNSSLFIDDKGNYKLYRKIHLFFEEKTYFLPGNLPFEAFSYRNARIGMMICFDWIFPESARCLALSGADIICHPANLVLPYCQNAMTTRSIENHVFTVTANRIGEENRGGNSFKFTGKSQITDCNGNVIYRADDNKEEMFVADINIEIAKDKKVNDFNNLWHDRRVEYYHSLGEKSNGITQ